jgi:pimeloyl-ACP methyl ester carboxylesterase
MTTVTRAVYDGVDTRVLSVPGNGTSVVMLHGYGDSAATWQAVLDEFAAAGQRALAVDLPGFGEAGPRRPGPLQPQFDSFVDAVLEEHGPAVVVGNSLGAATAVRAAARNTERVKGLVALDDPLSGQTWLARLARRKPASERLWSTMGRTRVPPRALRWATSRVLHRVLYGTGHPPDPEYVGDWLRSMGRMSDLAMLGRNAFQYAWEMRAGHAGMSVTCPAIIVHGARDAIIPVHSSLVLHRLIPGSRFVVLPRSGHCPQLDDPGAVARLTMRLTGELAP